MRISRVYFEAQLEPGSVIQLPPESSHYLARVLRLRIDDRVHVFNPSDGEFLARIAQIKKSGVELVIEESIAEELAARQSKLKIHLGLGLSRGDRMDFAIQKSTELGVAEITPLYTEHAEVKLKADRVEKKLQHWQKIAISASEQCGRIDIPTINAPRSLNDWQQHIDAGFNVMLDPSAQDRLEFDPAAEPIQQVNLLIGSEGGFAEAELKTSQELGFTVVTLGRRILRTETAPIAALAILQNLYGDM